MASYDGFEKGFLGLSTIVDFICGKENRDRKPGEKYRKNWHQRRLKNEAIENIAGKLAVIEGQSFSDFEELLEAVRKENIKYFKHTNSYDFAFRYGLNHGIVPEKYVYIHAGARDGAMSLRRAGYVAFDPTECRIAIESFPEELRTLSASHLENFLCVMKKQLAVLPSISSEL